MQRALAVSFAANCVLLVVRTALALLSGSLSLVVATLDAVLDVLSSILLFWSAHEARQRNKCEPRSGAKEAAAVPVWVGCLASRRVAILP